LVNCGASEFFVRAAAVPPLSTLRFLKWNSFANYDPLKSFSYTKLNSVHAVNAVKQTDFPMELSLCFGFYLFVFFTVDVGKVENRDDSVGPGFV
jgi:hypothetical protein